MSQSNTAHIDDPTKRIELECAACGERVTYSPRMKQRIRGKLYHDCEGFGPPFSVVREGDNDR